VPARLINSKYITIRAEKVASPVTALQTALRDHDEEAVTFCGRQRVGTVPPRCTKRNLLVNSQSYCSLYGANDTQKAIKQNICR